ncbi:hypothetical protein [Imhoffiella purpurea]|uniref:Protein rhiA n=1 Tax=Imhoffiella purpurea TaxID=1249627 RepID=W9VVR7_9GAMM|nr:hypothetical protein [Imhoffiella purpurea]EXJ14535.1 hypothetical protein D779_2676 [Imhoffiella purpurea]
MINISYARPHHDRVHESMMLASAAIAASQPYSLTLKNQSASPWTFFVYQQMPKEASANVFSLAWFASPFVIVPNNQISFEWDVDYGFVWGATGIVRPGVTFDGQGQQPASPSGANTTQFTTSPGPHLTSPVQGDPQGSLVIKDASNVPNNTFSVGISMSGAGTFVTSAGPNLLHTFTPTPSYWIAAGNNVRVGEILDITTITQTANVVFPVNVYKQTYTLNQSNTWDNTTGQ